MVGGTTVENDAKQGTRADNVVRMRPTGVECREETMGCDEEEGVLEIESGNEGIVE